MKREYEPVSSLTHLIGAVLAAAGLVVLLVFSALWATAWHVVSFAVYGASMVLLFSASAVYHFLTQRSKAKRVLRRIDHSFIFLLIAGTYTPVCLVALRGPWGWTLFGIIWGLASVGIVLKACDIKLSRTLSTLMYICMGWLALIALVPLSQVLSGAALFWMFLGGVCYTGGAVFYVLEQKLWNHMWGPHEVWHVFVMLGAFCHFWMMLRHVLYL